MRNIITAALLCLTTILLAACGTSALGIAATVGAKAVSVGHSISEARQTADELCAFYREHRADVVKAREHFSKKENFDPLPESVKQAFITINDALPYLDQLGKKACGEVTDIGTGVKPPKNLQGTLDSLRLVVKLSKQFGVI
jgi:hypothetical protein